MSVLRAVAPKRKQSNASNSTGWGGVSEVIYATFPKLTCSQRLKNRELIGMDVTFEAVDTKQPRGASLLKIGYFFGKVPSQPNQFGKFIFCKFFPISKKTLKIHQNGFGTFPN